jgi:outer membrane protein OmpA-like peptidoglycan-associated protein
MTKMKKTVLFMMAASLLVGTATAQTTAEEQEYVFQEQDLQPLEPTYLDNVFSANVWDNNWFLSVKGGMSAFTGKPVGHGDFFDRKKPLLNISAGKWFTPFIGGRLAYQGLQLIDSDIESRSYQNVHADFLYNIAAHFKKSYDELPKWDLIPYAGCGIIRNSYTHNKPFAISYGIIGRYRLADRLHVSAEIGATTTWQDFDGKGASNKLGDHLLQASIGLDFTIGKVGWKKVIDPKPYIFQNDILMDHLGKMKDENFKLNKMHKKDAMALAEMRKILEIEGLLDKYDLAMNTDGENVKTHPRNNYSGLNSLRARLRNKGWNGDEDDYKPVLKEGGDDVDSSAEMSPEQYFQVMKDGKIFVGSPIFFFFKLGTDELTERAQIINIKEVASTIKKYGLCARIVGAADSQTGTAYINERLSAKRADYIAKMMREQGVSQDMIQTQYRGGISSYEPQTGNRNTCVMLYFK